MTRGRRYTRGAGALLGVLLLMAFAGAALTLHYEARGQARGQALDRAAGGIFAAWFQAAHRASLEHAVDIRREARGRRRDYPDAAAVARARAGPAGIARCAGP